MIVDARQLSVRPIADRAAARDGGGDDTLDVDRGPIAWSNELALHVIELKNLNGRPALAGAAGAVSRTRSGREMRGSRRMSRALHAHRHAPVDESGARDAALAARATTTSTRTFDRIFDCRGHGWSNLQSMHINLPFADDDEFGRLHAAIRVLSAAPAGARGQLAARRGQAHRAHGLRAWTSTAPTARRIPSSVTGLRHPRDRVHAARLRETDARADVSRSSRRSIPKACCATSGRMRAAPSRASTATPSRSARRRAGMPAGRLAIASATAAVVESLYRERAHLVVDAAGRPDADVAARISCVVRKPKRRWSMTRSCCRHWA